MYCYVKLNRKHYNSKIARASTFGGRGHIILSYPPLMASQLAMGGYATIHLW